MRYRDPVHAFIEVKPLENKIIDSAPFQRLRNIKQLALTNLVYHGAEQIWLLQNPYHDSHETL